MNHVLTDSWTIVRRNVIKLRRVPDLLVFTTLQPIMFVLLFGFVFGVGVWVWVWFKFVVES